jgi:hypothetical protein
MGALPFVAGALRKVDKFLFNDTTVGIVRTFCSYTGAPPIVADLLALGTLLGAGFTADLAPEMGSNVSYASTEITDLSSATAAQATSEFVGLVGSEGGATLPAAACFMVNGGIARRYRGGHQKSFIPFGTQTDLLTDQEWEVASADGFLASWAAFQNIIPINAWAGSGIVENCNVSYYEGFTSVQNPVTLRWRNIPKLRVTPIVDVLQTYSYSPLVRFQTRRGILS